MVHKTHRHILAVVDYCILHFKSVALVFVALLVVTVILFIHVPRGFLPSEDQGAFLINAQKRSGTTFAQTKALTRQMIELIEPFQGIEHIAAITGVQGINSALLYVGLKPWDERRRADESMQAIVSAVNQKLQSISSAQIHAFGLPPIHGLGSADGFELQLQDYRSGSMTRLASVAKDFVVKANKHGPVKLSTMVEAETPQVLLDVDRKKAASIGLSAATIFESLQLNFGSVYVNDFNHNGRTYEVWVQSESNDRDSIDSILDLKLRNDTGAMIPLATFTTAKIESGPSTIAHHNMFRTAHISGTPHADTGTGEAMAWLQKFASQTLPDGMGIEWTGQAFQQQKASRWTPYIFALVVLFVYLVLASLYESWLLPVGILLVVPLAILGALGLQYARGLENDIYCQIGLVMLVGLASKNSILIVEFARRLVLQGVDVKQAARQAVDERLRPILMTALAVIVGALPLVFASGAGQGARHSLGTCIVGGMLTATLLSLVFIPSFFVVMMQLRGRQKQEALQNASERGQP